MCALQKCFTWLKQGRWDSRYNEDLMCYCWLEDGGGHVIWEDSRCLYEHKGNSGNRLKREKPHHSWAHFNTLLPHCIPRPDPSVSSPKIFFYFSFFFSPFVNPGSPLLSPVPRVPGSWGPKDRIKRNRKKQSPLPLLGFDDFRVYISFSYMCSFELSSCHSKTKDLDVPRKHFSNTIFRENKHTENADFVYKT